MSHSTPEILIKYAQRNIKSGVIDGNRSFFSLIFTDWAVIQNTSRHILQEVLGWAVKESSINTSSIQLKLRICYFKLSRLGYVENTATLLRYISDGIN